MATPMPALADGAVTLSEWPGLGVTPDEDAVRGFLRSHR
jgi:D-galactarolactone cycloisomerase